MAPREPRRGWPLSRLRWNLAGSLTTRILAVNIIALGLLAGSLFYLDSYRNRLLEERFLLARREAEIVADALALTNRAQRHALIKRIGEQDKLRLRIYDRDGDQIIDSFDTGAPSFSFIDPASQPWYMKAARGLDQGMDFLLGAAPIADYREPDGDTEASWPEIAEARTTGVTAIRQRRAPDRTPVITAATPIGNLGQVLLISSNAIDVTENVRNARQTLAIIVGAATIISILLSLFLARTIVQPLRMLVRAAVRVRLGRERAVVVPRLPQRRDEIGLLARAISDMTSALRSRIDSVETFAADVAHELKNPLASLRSALESLNRVEQPELRQQLLGIAAHDVLRIDRLVTEIADASRIDAELSRTTFEPVDLLSLVNSLADARRQRGINGDCTLTVSARGQGPWRVSGDPQRLERVLDNLLDNAVSFSPAKGEIGIAMTRWPGHIAVTVSDQGPGISPEAREQVFERFHSLRPADENFGEHSGLGLAIARTIIEAHDGTLRVCNPVDAAGGACLEFNLPAWIGDE